MATSILVIKLLSSFLLAASVIFNTVPSVSKSSADNLPPNFISSTGVLYETISVRLPVVDAVSKIYPWLFI